MATRQKRKKKVSRTTTRYVVKNGKATRVTKKTRINRKKGKR